MDGYFPPLSRGQRRDLIAAMEQALTEPQRAAERRAFEQTVMLSLTPRPVKSPCVTTVTHSDDIRR